MSRSAALSLLRIMGLVVLLVARPAGADEAAALCPAQLEDRLEAITAEQLSDQTRWGAMVQPLGNNGSTLYARNPQQYFTPASNAKLLTAAAALIHLGPDFRLSTSVYAASSAAADFEDASSPLALRLVGQGDPSFTSDDLRQMAYQVSQAGITQVSHVIGDERYLGARFINPTWEWEDVQSGYGAPVSSLMVDQNAIGIRLFPQTVGQPLRLEWEQPQMASQWQVINQSATVAPSEPEFLRVGRDWSRPVLTVQGQLRAGADFDRSAVAVTNPSAHVLQQFEAALRREGVAVLRPSHSRVDQPEPQTEPQTGPALSNAQQAIATIVSPPLSDLLVEVNAHSRNLYAESLLLHLGRQDGPGGTRAAGATGALLLAAGLEQVRTILTPLGVTGAYQLADGSGLSRRSLVTPQAIVQTLQAMAQHPYSAIYRSSLAIAGETGTLRSRFRGTSVAGRLWGKSGGLTGVSSLSGYLDPPGYAPLAFSLLIDHSHQPGAARRQTLDAMVEAIAALTPCSAPGASNP